jgi:FtsH-binding integral membrane protein
VARLAVQARARFILRTYAHLFGAVMTFAAIDTALFVTDTAESVARAMMGMGQWVVLGGFLLGGMLFSHLAQSVRSKPLQYAALAAYVGLYALISVPLLVYADAFAPGAIRSAGVVTVIGFSGLTAVAFTTRKDFSFLGSLVRWGIVVLLVAIVASWLFGFELGTLFSVAVVGLMGTGILYETSNVLHHHDEDGYVGAALQLFSYTAVMFMHLVRIFAMSRD